jgi:hypothetical protein
MAAVTSGSWRVDPDGVDSVLQRVGKAGEAIATALQPLDAAVKSGATAADGLDGGMVCTVGVPSAGLISAALDAFMADVSADIGVISQRVPAAAHGLHEAAQAVISGDDEMAARIQAAALQAMHPGIGHPGAQ